jgi:hypothetical protein
MLEDLDTLYQLVVTFVAAGTALYGFLKNKAAKLEAAKTAEVQAYFDPDNTTVTTPPAGTPKQSYCMSDETKQFLISGESAADQKTMLDQIAEAEAAGLTEYKVVYSRGYYKIKYGMVASSAKFS